jgi:hypothetical protein
MKSSIVILAALVLSACATCRQYPVACAIGSAVIVGSVAATVAAHSDRAHTPPHMSNVSPPNCGSGATCE